MCFFLFFFYRDKCSVCLFYIQVEKWQNGLFVPQLSPSIMLPLKANWLKQQNRVRGLGNWLGGIDQNLLDKAEINVKAHLNYIYKRIFVNFNGFMYFFLYWFGLNCFGWTHMQSVIPHFDLNAQFVSCLNAKQVGWISLSTLSADTGTLMDKSDSWLHNLFALALEVAHSHLWLDYVTSNTVFNKKENDFVEPCVFFCLQLNKNL